MLRLDRVEMVSLKPASRYSSLAVCWIFGLLGGTVLFLYAGTPVVSLMRSVPLGSVSIVSLLLTGLIPFLFTAYAAFLSEPWVLFVACFCKGFLFSFVSLGISIAFSSAGWLMRRILLFSGDIWCVALLFLWIRILSGQKACWFAVLTAGALACGISCYIISPFLVCLIEIKKG